MRRLSKDDRVRVALTLNGRKLAAEAEPRTLLSDFLRQGARRDRHPCRLRARHLRRLHRADRRRRHALLPHARGTGRRPRGQNRGIARRGRRRAQSAANRVPRPSRAAMRLLHARHIDVVHRLPRPQSAPDHRRNPRSLVRPPLPLHRLRRDRQGGGGGGHHPPPRKRGRGTMRSMVEGARAPR